MLTYHVASHKDIPKLRALAEQIWRASYVEMLSPAQMDYMLLWMYSAEKIWQELSLGVHWEIVRLGGEDAGYLALTFEADGIAKLDKLYLLPAHHGRGFGQQMLARAAAIAEKNGAREIRLQVNKGNLRALRAYEKFGFVRIDEAVFDIGGGFVMDDFIMVRKVEN